MRDLAAIRDEVIEFVNCVGEEHVCLGSDLFGPPHSNPTEVDIGSLPLLADALRSKGLSSRGVDRIMGENYKRLLVDVLS
jgi:microsomal dipeptidase-like Zn-dependent dipeptidase